MLNVWLRMSIKSVFLMSFPFILYFFGFYEKIELENIKKIISVILNSQNRKMK